MSDAGRSRNPHRFGLAVLAVVAVGGAVGAVARYFVGLLNPDGTSGFPIGTFVANVSGAFGLALLLAALVEVRSAWMVKLLVATGFFGAFTTFSTFAVEVVERVRDGHGALAVLYAVGTLAAGLASAALGWIIGTQLRRVDEVGP